MEQLILIVNDACTLGCPYCLVRLRHRFMEMRTAKAALISYLTGPGKEVTIKFSGGEPLVGFAKTRSLVHLARALARRHKKKLRIQLCTNAAFLKAVHTRFLCAPDIDLSITLGMPDQRRHEKTRLFQQALTSTLRISAKRPVVVNTVITPGQAAFFYRHFLFLRSRGLRHLNFLPAYYIRWTKNQLDTLKKNFRQIGRYLRTHSDQNFFIKNAHVTSRTPLFNDGIVVDCRGDIYMNNFFLFRGFEKLALRLKVGNIHKGLSLEKPLAAYRPTLETLRPYLSTAVYASTRAADRILSDFTRTIHRLK